MLKTSAVSSGYKGSHALGSRMCWGPPRAFGASLHPRSKLHGFLLWQSDWKPSEAPPMAAAPGVEVPLGRSSWRALEAAMVSHWACRCNVMHEGHSYCLMLWLGVCWQRPRAGINPALRAQKVLGSCSTCWSWSIHLCRHDTMPKEEGTNDTKHLEEEPALHGWSRLFRGQQPARI